MNDMTNEERAYALLINSGVYEDTAQSLFRQHSPERIEEVVRYIITNFDYSNPGGAIVKALNENWEIPKVNRDLVEQLLAESNSAGEGTDD